MAVKLVNAASMPSQNVRQWCGSKEVHRLGHFDKTTRFNYVERMDGVYKMAGTGMHGGKGARQNARPCGSDEGKTALTRSRSFLLLRDSACSRREEQSKILKNVLTNVMHHHRFCPSDAQNKIY